MKSQPDLTLGTTARRASVFLRPHARFGAIVLLATVFLSAANALEPLVLKKIFDALAAGEAPSVLRGVLVGAGLLLGIAVVREVLGALTNWLVWHVRLGVHEDLLQATVAKLHTLPVEHHREERVTGLLTRLDRSITGFITAVQELGTALLPALVYLVVSVCVMLTLDWRLMLAVVVFLPIPPLVAVWAAPEQMSRERALLDRWVDIYGRFGEVLTGIVTVRSFTMESREKHRFMSGVREANRLVLQGVGRDSSVGGVRSLAGGLARVTAVAFGGLLVLRGEATVGTVVAFLGYVTGLFGPVLSLSQLYGTIRRASISLEQLFGLLDRPEELGDPERPLPLGDVFGRVDFRDVRFGYRKGEALIRGITLHAEPGETVALVGPSGSGKSTLMALLQRLYDPWEGRILIDGRDIRCVAQRDLRAHMGVVLQDPLLFEDSVRDNIAYGRPSATMEEIEAAARAANADEFIRRLPDGYDTKVGERGGRLSVGERQRVAIARALLKDPRILILDEPTSALDVRSESRVQEAIERLRQGRTTFVIAHRLSTVVGADRILVLDGGAIVESGTHVQLMTQDGYYADMVSRQVRGLLPEEPWMPVPARRAVAG